MDDIVGVRRGHIRIGPTQTASRCLELAALLGGFRGQVPEVTIAMSTGPRQELLDALAATELDLVLAPDGEPAADGIDVRELLPPEPLVAVVSRDHLTDPGDQVSLAELTRAAPFVEFRSGTELRRRMDAALPRQASAPRSCRGLSRRSWPLRSAMRAPAAASVPAGR